jgi:hypothetical protein
MHATHYAYDVHGNVNTLIQDVPELNSVNNQYKKINYFYDLVSNKVNLIIFDKGKNDEYQHRYTYDADNRVTQMETSRDGINWDNDASYEYYDHGPLARTELGDNKVQGLDYVYTIQGWIKGVNSNTMNETRDPGRDGDIGLTSNEHAYVAKDAVGYSLSYFEGDYQSIQSFSTTDYFVAKTTGSNLVNARNDLWNGNIGSMVTCLPQASTYSSSKTITPEAFGNAYKYDQLNRIAQSRVFTNISYSQNEWLSSGAANPQAFGTNYTYDPMGNILSQKRNGAGTTGNPLDLDNLVYGYNTNSDGLISNRLYQVRDSVSATNYTDDIDNQDTLNKSIAVLETANNYGYDELGNLKHDKQEQIARIDWTVYGKIKRIVRTSGSSKPNLVFGYDASGNRLWKKVITPGVSDSIKTFYYVRDAQGNEMCHYIKYKDSANRIMFVSEEHSLYGSSRVGVDSRRDTLYMAGNYHPAWMDSGKFYRALGLKNYELSNHLGNVLVTVSDKPIHKEISGNIYFEAEITTINDYYPFGSSLNTRSFSTGSGFRFGFNTQEKDKEIYNNYETYTATFWEYDGRLGRRWNVDPVVIYQESVFSCFSNNPIYFVDVLGNKKTDNYTMKQDGTVKYEKTADKTDKFYYEEKDYTITKLAELEKTTTIENRFETIGGVRKQVEKAGITLVKFDFNGIKDYGLSKYAGISNHSDNVNNWLQPKVALSVLVVGYLWSKDPTYNSNPIPFHNGSSKTGYGHWALVGKQGWVYGHAFGQNVDLGYAGKAKITTANDFDIKSNRNIVNLFTKHGFSDDGKLWRILTYKEGVAAIPNTTACPGHANHLHLQKCTL